jgi:hypothetical protein
VQFANQPTRIQKVKQFGSNLPLNSETRTPANCAITNRVISCDVLVNLITMTEHPGWYLVPQHPCTKRNLS